MDSSILNHNTQDAEPASTINPDKTPPDLTIDDIYSTTNTFFSDQSPFLKKSLDDGAIYLLKEKFDVITFITTVLILSMDSIKEENELTSSEKIQIDQIVDTQRSLLKLAKSIGTDKTSLNCVIKTLSYCLNSYKKYYNIHDRRKEIQE